MLSNALTSLCFALLAGQDPRMTMFRPRSHCRKSTAFVSYGHHYRQSFPASAVTLHQQKQRDNRVARYNPAIAINKKIVDLGKRKDWKEILKVYEEERDQFNDVNYATVMSQLGRIHSFDRRNPVFLRFLDDLAEKIEQRGFEWIGVREVSSIIHAIGKMRLNSNTGKGIIQWMSKLENAEKFFTKAEPQAVSNVAWAFARLEIVAPVFFRKVGKRAQWLVDEGNPQNIANTATRYDPSIAINGKIVNLGRKKNWNELLKVYEEESDRLNAISYATMMTQLGRIYSFDKTNPVFLRLLDDLAEKIENRGFEWVDARSFSNIIYAVGKMNLRNVSATRLLKSLSRKEVAAKFVGQGNSRDISNAAWAFARLGFDAPDFFAEIDSHAEWLVEDGNPQDVANIAWACAKLGVSAPNFFAEIDSHAEWLVNEGYTQAVANIAWSCATLGINGPNLFAVLNHHAEWLVKEGNPQDIAHAAWACATLGFDAPNLFAEIDSHAGWLVDEGNSQDVANTACACATLGFNAPNFFAEIDCHAEWLVKEGSPQAVANTAWACATLGFDALNLFAEIDRHADEFVQKGKPHEVANVAWSCSMLGYDLTNLLSEVEARADYILPRLTEQSVANTCFTIVVSDCTMAFEGLLVRLWGKVTQMHDNFNDIELRQLSQVKLLAVADGVKLPKPPENLSTRMNLAVKETEENIVSVSQKEVLKALEELGHSCELEVEPIPGMSLGGMLAIDVACKEKKIAVEFDGPLHFLKELGTGNISLKENGTTRAKRRFLEKLGWNVINIDYRDWRKVKRAGDEKQWLREKLIGCIRDNGCMNVASVDEPIEEERRRNRVEAELAVGQAVRVSGGNYQGMLGVVVRTTKHKALVLLEGNEKERMLAKRNVEGI